MDVNSASVSCTRRKKSIPLNMAVECRLTGGLFVFLQTGLLPLPAFFLGGLEHTFQDKIKHGSWEDYTFEALSDSLLSSSLHSTRLGSPNLGTNGYLDLFPFQFVTVLNGS